MAQIIERIVRSKYPPRDTRVLWLDTKDDLIKAFTPNGWTKVFANTAINTLRNAGYLFAGIATIDTNPETPDAKVFYIANGKGTYTNFGGLEVTEDEVVLLIHDTKWHKVATGIASQEKLTELERKVGDLEGYEYPKPIFVRGLINTTTGENGASEYAIRNDEYYDIATIQNIALVEGSTGNKIFLCYDQDKSYLGYV